MKIVWMVKKIKKSVLIIFLKSINHEMHLQEIKKSTLSIFDDKRCYINNIGSKPWNQCYWMVVKVNQSFEKTRHVENNDKFKKYFLRGQRNTRYHQKILSNKKKTYNLNIQYWFCQFFLENGNRYNVEFFQRTLIF